MSQQGRVLSQPAKIAAATYLTGRPPLDRARARPAGESLHGPRADRDQASGDCRAGPTMAAATPSRARRAFRGGIPKLSPKWIFALPAGAPMASRSRPGAASMSRPIMARSSRSISRQAAPAGPPRPTPGAGRRARRHSRGRQLVLFADERSNIYGYEFGSGKRLWQTLAEEHPLARVTGRSPLS